MQEEYKKKLEQEVQWYISIRSSNLGTESIPTTKETENKITSQREALETAKQMLHQNRGESRSTEMDWDNYGTHARTGEQPRQVDEMLSLGRGEEGKRKKEKFQTELLPLH